MASDAADHAAIHARAIRLAARLADLNRRLHVPDQLDYNPEAGELIHRLRDDPDLLVKLVAGNRSLIEPAILFVLRSNSAAHDVPITIRFVERFLQRCPPADTDLFRALWVRFGGSDFAAATFGNFFHVLLGPSEINLDLDLVAVVRAVDDQSMVPVLLASSGAPSAPRYFSFEKETATDAGHVQERTRAIRRRLEARAELCTEIVLELVHAIRRSLDAFPPGFTMMLKMFQDRIDAGNAGEGRHRLRSVFLDAVIGLAVERPDSFDFVPQHFLDSRSRSSLKQLSQIVTCLGSGSTFAGSSANIVNTFVQENGAVVDQLIADLLKPNHLFIASPLQDTPVQHIALSKSHLNTFMVAMARFLESAVSDDPLCSPKLSNIDGESSSPSSSKDLLLNCFDQFDTTLKPVPLRPNVTRADLAAPAGGLARVLFECLSRLPVCGIVQSGDGFLQYLRHTVAFARLKADRHQSSDLNSVISHLSGFIGYAATVHPEVDWGQKLVAYMDSILSEYDQHINEQLKAFESYQLSLAIMNNAIQNMNAARNSLMTQQSVQNFIRNARFNFKVVIKSSTNVASQVRLLARRTAGEKAAPGASEIHCRSLDQIVLDLRDLMSKGKCDVVPSVIDSILKRLAVTADRDLAGIADARKYISAYIMGRLYPHLFAASESDNGVLQRQLTRFDGITLENLDMVSSPILESSLFLPIAEIGKLNQYISPSKKVDCIVRATRQAMDALRLNAVDSGDVPGSDQLLPVIVFIILKASPAELHRNCCFCRLYWNADDEFVDNPDLQSLYRFSFVQFLSAVKFIAQMTPGSLSASVASEQPPPDRNALAA